LVRSLPKTPPTDPRPITSRVAFLFRGRLADGFRRIACLDQRFRFRSQALRDAGNVFARCALHARLTLFVGPPS
jgi:hypothetical protein